MRMTPSPRALLLGLLLLAPFAALAAVDRDEVVSLTNADRRAEGLPPLSRSALLTSAAQMKADDMAREGYYAHVSPSGKSPLYWLDRAGYRYQNAGENLDAFASSARSAERAWMGSPEHRANILRLEFSELGVGVSEGTYKGENSTFVVVLFATPLAPAPAKPAPAPSRALPQKQNAPVASSTQSEAFKKAVAKIVAPVLAPLSSMTPLTEAASSTRATLGTTSPSFPLPLKETLPRMDPLALPETATSSEPIAASSSPAITEGLVLTADAPSSVVLLFPDRNGEEAPSVAKTFRAVFPWIDALRSQMNALGARVRAFLPFR